MAEPSDVVSYALREHIDNLRRRLEQLNCKNPEEQQVLLTKNEETKIATITIRSGAKNALSGRMISQLTDILDDLYAWSQGHGAILMGHGNTFCSGSDLVSVRETTNYEAGLALAEIMQYNLMRIQRLPMITVSWIEGYALGGGAELSMATDLRIMASNISIFFATHQTNYMLAGSAKIGFVHVRNGISCGLGGGWRMVRLLGSSRATELLASGRVVGAEEALRIGLANGLANVQAEVDEFMQAHTVGAKDTIKALKSMINSAQMLPPDEALKLEGHLFASTWGKEAHLRALKSNIKHKQ